jgi:hypothetical protein
MKGRSVRKSSTAICLLVTSLSAATPALATWYMNDSEGYYKPQEYHNERFGDFPPADIDQKLFGHLNDEKKAEESKSVTDNTSPYTTTTNQPVSSSNQQVSNPAQNYPEQNFQQPAAYGSNDPGRNYMSPGLERHIRTRNAHLNELRNKRGSGFSAPWDNSRSSFSGPWNNRGSSFSAPWDNSRSSFSGPWNNRGSSFSGPWDNNGSNFSMPWGNNNSGSNFSPFGKGSGWSW